VTIGNQNSNVTRYDSISSSLAGSPAICTRPGPWRNFYLTGVWLRTPWTISSISFWSVVAALGEVRGHHLGHVDLLGDLVHRVALVREPQRLVVDVAVHIPLQLEVPHDRVVPPHRPVVHAEEDHGLVPPHDERLIQLRPERLRAASSARSAAYAANTPW
jgi:hypothetical protein